MPRPKLVLDGIERMYADELFWAVEAAVLGESTDIESEGVIVARIVPVSED